MINLKHIGRIKTNKRRAIIAYRTIPTDPHHALVILTEALPSDEHDTLIKLVESPAGQDADELAEAMMRTYLPDGRNMLAGFHATGQLKKVSTADVEMTPNTRDVIGLDKLNEIIAEQRGVDISDLAVKPTHSTDVPRKPVVAESAAIATAVPDKPLSNQELAQQMRSQADAMFKAAQSLRIQANEISPAKTKTTVSKKPVESD